MENAQEGQKNGCITSNVVAGKAHELARLYKCSSYPPIYKWVVGEPTCWQANLAKLPEKEARYSIKSGSREGYCI